MNKKAPATEKKEELQYKPYMWIVFWWIIAFCPLLLSERKLWRLSALLWLFLLGCTIDRIKHNREYNKLHNINPKSDFLDLIKEYMWWWLIPIVVISLAIYRDDTIQPRLAENWLSIVYVVVWILLLWLVVFLSIKLIKRIIKVVKMPWNIEKIREHLDKDRLTDEEIDTVAEYLWKHKK